MERNYLSKGAQMEDLFFLDLILKSAKPVSVFCLTLKNVGGGSKWPAAQEIACHFIQDPPRSLKTLDFS